METTDDFLNQSFGRATSLPRRIGILPEETRTPQGTIDLVRGKKKKRRSILTQTGSRGSSLSNPRLGPK